MLSSDASAYFLASSITNELREKEEAEGMEREEKRRKDGNREGGGRTKEWKGGKEGGRKGEKRKREKLPRG